MKKCPNCQKEFPDTMRFCQTDGTPLMEETSADDPLKTTVVRQEDIASSIPSSDPFKTVVGSSETKEESGDLLQLPVEFDPMKTMVATPIVQDKTAVEEPKPEPPKVEEYKPTMPVESPFSGFSAPSEPLPEAKEDHSTDPTLLQPEPPRFNEPELTPPSFTDYPSKKEEDDLPQTVMQNPWDSGSAPKSEDSPFSNNSPFSKPSDVSSSTPFDAPKSPFDSPYSQPEQKPLENPQASYDTPSYQEPQNQFGSPPLDQMNQNYGNQPLQQNEWNPPPSPEQGWQDQGLGANTPFQPPVAMAGQNQTLPIISLVFGILSLCCYIGPVTGLVALITGYLGMKNVNTDPNQYGGKGLAMAGMIVGGIFFLVWTLLWLLYIVGIVGMIGMGGIR